MGAAQRFPINSHHLIGNVDQSTNPINVALGKCIRIEQGEHSTEGVMRRGASLEFQKPLEPVLLGFGIGGIGKKESKAVVAVTARIINTDTGEILSVATGKGESKRSGTSLIGAGGDYNTAAGGAVDMSSKNFADTILGEAVGQAVGSLSGQLQENASRLPTRTISIDGLVADASGGTVILNVGTSAGLKIGDKLILKRPVREVKDPETGKVLRRVENTLGEVVITEVDAASSVGTYSGATPAKVGDRVRNQ